jgi:hypothetical protein
MNAKEESVLVKVIKKAVGLPTGNAGCSCSTPAPKATGCCTSEPAKSASEDCACTDASVEQEDAPAQ